MLVVNVVAVLCAIVSAVIWRAWKKNSTNIFRKIPGPSPLPLIGNALDCFGGGNVLIEVCHQQWPMTYGEIYSMTVGSKRHVFISSPNLLESIVNNVELIDKGTDYNLLHPWMGLGLLTSSGDKWKSHRRMLTPAFHFKILEEFFDTFNHQSLILCDKIWNLCHHEEKVEIEVDQLMTLCTLDIICESAMGCKINAQTKESDYVKSVSRMAKMVLKRAMRPWMDFDSIYNWTCIGAQYRRCLQSLHSFVDQIIKTRQRESKPSMSLLHSDCLKMRRPFLDLLLEASLHGSKLSDVDIRDEVNTFMFEGHDTTSMAMCWFLYCMAANPTHQEKLKDELHDIFGDSDRRCTRHDLTKLNFLERCIKESSRLYPSVPVISRLPVKDVQIGEYLIPAGCNINISIYALHRNPRIYPDPLLFDPDRFLPEQSAMRHPFAYIPFSAGMRNCIGQKFAMAEEKVILSSLIRHFKFELSERVPKPTPAWEMTLRSMTGFHLLVSRR